MLVKAYIKNFAEKLKKMLLLFLFVLVVSGVRKELREGDNRDSIAYNSFVDYALPETLQPSATYFLKLKTLAMFPKVIAVDPVPSDRVGSPLQQRHDREIMYLRTDASGRVAVAPGDPPVTHLRVSCYPEALARADHPEPPVPFVLTLRRATFMLPDVAIVVVTPVVLLAGLVFAKLFLAPRLG